MKRASIALTMFVFVLGCGSHGIDPGGDDAGTTEDTGTIDPNMGSQLRIVPPTATIQIDDGDVTNKAVTFHAEMNMGGTWAPVDGCTWGVGNVDIGTFSTPGVFSPTAKAGGPTEISCTIGQATATGTVTVSLKDLVNQTMLSPGEIATLTGATTNDPSVSSLLYPFDKTVFPRGMSASPEVMWTAPTMSASDIYALDYNETYVHETFVFNAPSPGRFQPPLPSWEKLTSSSLGKDVKVALYRLAGGKGGTPYAGPVQSWTLARASLKGTVYFWQVTNGSDGDVVKMPFGKTPAKFLQSNGQCTGCHAVSRDGSAIAAGTSANGWPSAYLSQAGTQSFLKTSEQSGYRDISKDGSVIAYVPCSGSNNYKGEPVTLADAKTGAPIGNSGLENFGLTSTPAFSGDSKLLAFSVRNQPNATDQQHNIFYDSDLALSDFDLKNRKATNNRTLVKATNGETLVFPSFTPDAKRVAYQNGNQVRARNVAIGQWPWTATPSKADLDIVNTDGTNIVALANANGTEKHNFHPIFSPVVQGGYFWVVFTGLRTYGNRLTNTGDYDYNHCLNDNWSDCRSRQLWVAAIDPTAPNGADPSHPAFWLPGQDVTHQNFDAYWTLDQCKAKGSSCEAGFECCEGTCHLENGKKTCGDRMGCANESDTCTMDADCCSGASCIGGVCSTKIN